MIETQAVEWFDASGAPLPSPATAHRFAITGTPRLQVSGGNRFTTQLRFSFSQAGSAVALAATVDVAAAMWGLATTIEPLMLQEASDQISAFFAFAADFFGTARRAPAASVEDEASDDSAATHEAAVGAAAPPGVFVLPSCRSCHRLAGDKKNFQASRSTKPVVRNPLSG